MNPSMRAEFNRHFTREKYQSFLDDLNRAYNYEITFRVAESPLFIDREFKAKLIKASDQIVDFIAGGDIRKKTSGAIPLGLAVPNETDHTLFLALDFAIVKEHGEFQPRLIEMQGFPSLFGFQDFLSTQFRTHYPIPSSWHSHFVDPDSYRSILSKALLNGHQPENVILLEIDPIRQNTAIDFLVTKRLTGIPFIHIGDVMVEGRSLFYMRNGKKTLIHRIYNRVIFDELVKRKDLNAQFTMREEVDVEWAGHPNWFFRISKYTMPMIESEYVPECKFLNTIREIPEDLENYVLKPLFSFSGTGVIFHVNRADITAIPEAERHHYLLQRKVQYEPVVQAPDGMVKAEVRLLFIWEDGNARPTLMTNLVRFSRGEMIGVKYNKDKTWVGGTVGFFK